MAKLIKNVTREAKATMGIYENEREDRVHGVLAEFSDPGALLHAAEATREAGYKHFDTHSPFPVHGMDRAMGLGQSKVGYITRSSAGLPAWPSAPGFSGGRAASTTRSTSAASRTSPSSRRSRSCSS